MALNTHDLGKAAQEHVYAKAIAARTKGDVVYLGQDADGFVDITLVDDAVVHHIAVADQNIAAGAYGLYVIKGECVATTTSLNFTAGNGLKMLNGLVTDTAAAFPAAGIAGEAQIVFGSVKVGGTPATSITLCLHGKAFTATT